MGLLKRAKKPTVSMKAKVMFGSGSLGYSIVTQTFYGLFMFFGNFAHNIPGTLMGIISLLGTIWDGAGDPIFGHMSDKSNSLMLGSRHGYLLFGTLMVGITNVLIWCMPFELPVWAKFIYFLIAVLLFNTFCTVYQTPYHALGLDLTNDYYERTVIQGIKTVFFLIGMIIPTVLIGLLMNDNKDLSQYQNLGYISSIVTLICGVLSYLGTYSLLPRLRAKAMTAGPQEEKKEGSFKAIIKEFFEALWLKNFRALVLGYAITLMASAFITTVGLHFFQFTFLFNFDGVAVLLGSLFIMTILSQPFWMYMSRKIDKKPSLILGIVMAMLGIAYLAVIFVLYMYVKVIPDRPLWYLIPGMLIAGFGVGALFSMPSSMMGDVIAVDYARTGEVRTGTYNAFMTFSYKVSQGITSFIVGIMLDIIGFNSETKTQTPFVRGALGWLIIVGVSVVLIGGLLFYTQYSIYKKDVPYNEELRHNLE